MFIVQIRKIKQRGCTTSNYSIFLIQLSNLIDILFLLSLSSLEEIKYSFLSKHY